MKAQMREEREQERREAASKKKMLVMVTKIQARWRAKLDLRKQQEFIEARKELRDEFKADIAVRFGVRGVGVAQHDDSSTAMQLSKDPKYRMKRLFGFGKKLKATDHVAPTLLGMFAGTSLAKKAKERMSAINVRFVLPPSAMPAGTDVRLVIRSNTTLSMSSCLALWPSRLAATS